VTEGEFLVYWPGARQVGAGQWVAKSHPDQRTGSVSITRAADRWLVHDFGGRSTAELLAERGLTLGDLFDRPSHGQHLPLAERRALSQQVRVGRGVAALGAVLPALALVEVAAAACAAGEPLSEADVEGVRMACASIHRVRVDLQDAAR
jgi:hypothetical protein